jgi:hypothetical protein
MPDQRSRVRPWLTFAVLIVLAAVAIVWIVRTGEPGPGTGSGRAGSMTAADSVALNDSLEEAAERTLVRETMSLAEVASRGGVPVDSLVAELLLPDTVSRTVALRGLMRAYRFTVRDVIAARQRVRQRL